MLKKQIKIIFNKVDDSSKKGEFFEELVSAIFSKQRYTITERVNFTGMEIDLIATHKDRFNEKIYIECKAREALSSTDIKSFVFNAQFKDVPYAYFLSVSEYVHQVAGLIEEMGKKKEYQNLYFWGPSKIIELLEEAGTVEKASFENYQIDIRKEILVYSYFGIFRVLILKTTTESQSFTVIDAKSNLPLENMEAIELIKKYLEELNGLSYLSLFKAKDNNYKPAIEEIPTQVSETVAEVKQSDNWYDYLPTSRKHFVGRKDLLQDFSDYIHSIEKKSSFKRVFYIDGKSGWGKSSFVSAIRDKYSNKHNRNKYFVFAVDTRSANTNNFIALSFKAMIEKAYSNNFLDKEFIPNSVEILSNFDILESDSMKKLIKYLKEVDKYLIIIFDQFEDVFRKQIIFKTFYKFLMDVNNLCGNVLLGFSWKTEINIPIDHEAYYLWQTIKSETYCIHMREFDSKEVLGVINQLQKSISLPLESSIKRRIIEGSQGFPWLTKKLCIHTYNQIRTGKSIEKLVEQELNIQALFESDLETLGSEEVKALKYIAKRAFDGNIFDAVEVDDVLDNKVVTALINNRLVVKSGTKYNIYWDIFRDYLVTGEIPTIGESYILRQTPTLCLKVFLSFAIKNEMTLEELTNMLNNTRTENSNLNILRELINLGLVSKKGFYYSVKCKTEEINKQYFIKFIRAKFAYYTPYIKLNNIGISITSFTQLINLLKDTFKGIDIKNETWELYAKNFISWISFLELQEFDLQSIYISDRGYNKKLPVKKVKDQRESFTPQKTIQQDIEAFYELSKDIDNYDVSIHNKNLYDLSAIGVLYYWGGTVVLYKSGKDLLECKDQDEFDKKFAVLAKKPLKIQRAIELIKENDVKNAKEFRNIADELVENINSEIYRKHTLSKIYSWANFIIKEE